MLDEDANHAGRAFAAHREIGEDVLLDRIVGLEGQGEHPDHVLDVGFGGAAYDRITRLNQNSPLRFQVRERPTTPTNRPV